MFHVDNNSAVPVMPAVKPVVSAVTSFFTEGGNGVPPTYPGPDWFNIIQSELLAVLAAAGITPDKANNAQLLAAMKLLFLDASQNGADIQDKTAFLQNLGILNGLDFTGDISAPNIKADTLVTVGDGRSGLAKGGVDGAGFDGNNMNIKSWNGIGFQNTEDLAIRAYINTRLGIVAATEKVLAGTAYLYKNGDIFGDIWSTGAGQATQKWLSIYLNEKFSLKNDLGTAAKKDVGTGTGQIPDMSSFTSGGDGGESYWYKRPGLMVQSSIASAPVGDSTITLPFAPPTKLNFVEVIINESSSKLDGPLGCNKLNATQFKVSNWGSVPVQFRFIAWCE